MPPSLGVVSKYCRTGCCEVERKEVDDVEITTLIVLSFAMASATAWKSRTSLVISSKRSSGSAAQGVSTGRRPRPRFVARMMPKNYMDADGLAGGFGLL